MKLFNITECHAHRPSSQVVPAGHAEQAGPIRYMLLLSPTMLPPGP